MALIKEMLQVFFLYAFISAKQAIDQGRSPVIIDNTNTQAWEMKPYVEMVSNRHVSCYLFLTDFHILKTRLVCDLYHQAILFPLGFLNKFVEFYSLLKREREWCS